MQTGGLLALAQLTQARAPLAARLDRSRVDPDRPTVGRQLLDVEELEPVLREETLDRAERQVREVLVVDGVELAPLDQLQKMVELEGQDAVVRHESPEPAREAVQVGRVGEDVVRDDEIGAPVLTGDPLADLGAEELLDRGNAPLPRDGGDVPGRLDPEHTDAERLHELEEIPVVARDLDDEAPGPEAEPLRDRLDVAARMLEPRLGVRREVGVLPEDALRRDDGRQLDEEARPADEREQRIHRFRPVELVGLEVGVREWRRAEICEHLLQLRAAEAADAGKRPCHHTFQGASPEAHCSSSTILSRRLSMFCQ